MARRLSFARGPGLLAISGAATSSKRSSPSSTRRGSARSPSATSRRLRGSRRAASSANIACDRKPAAGDRAFWCPSAARGPGDRLDRLERRADRRRARRVARPPRGRDRLASGSPAGARRALRGHRPAPINPTTSTGSFRSPVARSITMVLSIGLPSESNWSGPLNPVLL